MPETLFPLTATPGLAGKTTLSASVFATAAAIAANLAARFR